MIKKIILTDEECDNIAVYLLLGIIIGTVVGAIVNKKILMFSLGGIIAILIVFIKILINKKIQ